MNTSVKLLGWGRPLVWIIALLLAILLGFAVFFIAMEGLGATSLDIPDLLAASLMAFCFGLPIGLAQWFILRRSIPRIGLWIVATLVAFLLASPLLLRWSGYFGPHIVLSSALKMGLLLGALLGLAQWLALPNRFSRGFWWIPVSMISWLAGTLVAMLFKSLSWSWGPILYWIGLFFSGTVFSVIGMLFLAKFAPAVLQGPVPSVDSPPAI